MSEETLIYDAGFDESFGRALEDEVVDNPIQTLNNFKNVFKKIIGRIEKLENAIGNNADAKVNVKIDIDREIDSIIVSGPFSELAKLMNNKTISSHCEYISND